MNVANSDTGLEMLILFAADEVSLGLRNHATLALRRVDADRLAKTLLGDLRSNERASLTALKAVNAIAVDFDLTQEAVARYLEIKPGLPGVLKIIRDTARDDLKRMIEKGERAGDLALRTLEVMAKYSKDLERDG